MAGFTCSHCGRWYRHEKNLERHVRSSHTSQPPFSCGQCGKSFNRADNLQRHICNCTGRGCDECGNSFSRDDNLQRHMHLCTGRGVAIAVAAATTVPEPAAEPISILQFKLQKTRELLLLLLFLSL